MPVLFVPQDAYVLINCSSDSSSPPIWSIDLANDSSSVQLQFATRKDQLNSRGFYNIEIPGIPLTSTLLINETANNNGTVIFCTREEALHIIFSVLGKTIIYSRQLINSLILSCCNNYYFTRACTTNIEDCRNKIG